MICRSNAGRVPALTIPSQVCQWLAAATTGTVFCNRLRLLCFVSVISAGGLKFPKPPWPLHPQLAVQMGCIHANQFRPMIVCGQLDGSEDRCAVTLVDHGPYQSHAHRHSWFHSKLPTLHFPLLVGDNLRLWQNQGLSSDGHGYLRIVGTLSFDIRGNLDCHSVSSWSKVADSMSNASLNLHDGVLEVKTFNKFENTTDDDLSATTLIIDSKPCKGLRMFLQKPCKGATLDVADSKLGNAMKEMLKIDCLHNSAVMELMSWSLKPLWPPPHLKDWDAWKKEMNWMALPGVNSPLVFTGQAAVWQKLFEQYNISKSDLDDCYGGAAFLALLQMTKKHRWVGSLAPTWIDAQLALLKQIVSSTYAFGMFPVRPIFSAGSNPKWCCTYIIDASPWPLLVGHSLDPPVLTNKAITVLKLLREHRDIVVLGISELVITHGAGLGSDEVWINSTTFQHTSGALHCCSHLRDYAIDDLKLRLGSFEVQIEHFPWDQHQKGKRSIQIEHFPWDLGGYDNGGLRASRISRRGECQDTLLELPPLA